MMRVAETVRPPRRRAGRIAYWVIVAIMAVCIVASLIWINLIGRGFRDPSASMENAVDPGSVLLVETGHGIRRGDVVVLDRPGSAGGTFIRRVIGLPGDRVSCCEAAGRVTVDGKPLEESYVYPGDQPSTIPFSVTLGSGQLWVLGDHRSDAIDSRMWGPVPSADVVGRVVAVFGGGSTQLLLRTPQTFVASGLAPPDGRIPWVFLPFALVTVAVPILVVLIAFGVVKTLIRRRRRRLRPTPR
jgi:signal peptidase I